MLEQSLSPTRSQLQIALLWITAASVLPESANFQGALLFHAMLLDCLRAHNAKYKFMAIKHEMCPEVPY